MKSIINFFMGEKLSGVDAVLLIYMSALLANHEYYEAIVFSFMCLLVGYAQGIILKTINDKG
ncbi:MAG: hypothetical protein Unbinned3818contig1000_18 [Prokaryotic dsDNA virus sp.]|nr:hypothetical protein [Phycisphaerae bacterium]QDP45947.1 MAG: hypothetical protein Unbinned3818contig1000_18 [Prokaryotic dsDNA virus sp.]|tara:strand:- start:480 stop:665 length:186 start_codon:yes stop_codon:yes gene_type:complete